MAKASGDRAHGLARAHVGDDFPYGGPEVDLRPVAGIKPEGVGVLHCGRRGLYFHGRLTFDKTDALQNTTNRDMAPHYRGLGKCRHGERRRGPSTNISLVPDEMSLPEVGVVRRTTNSVENFWADYLAVLPPVPSWRVALQAAPRPRRWFPSSASKVGKGGASQAACATAKHDHPNHSGHRDESED
jgi:hypothetical protein